MGSHGMELAPSESNPFGSLEMKGPTLPSREWLKALRPLI